MADTATLPPVSAAPARKRFTGEEVLAFMASGAWSGQRLELLDGEIWEMPSEGAPHGRLAVWLNKQLVRGVPDGVAVGCERTIRLAETHWPEPDFCLFPEVIPVDQVRGPDALLVIEIADTSVQADLQVKGPRYRDYGVREYWVVDVPARVTHVHLLDGGWPEPTPVPFESPLTPALIPGLTLRLADGGV